MLCIDLGWYTTNSCIIVPKKELSIPKKELFTFSRKNIFQWLFKNFRTNPFFVNIILLLFQI